MLFWLLAFKAGVTAEQLKGAVITETNQFGEITPKEYEIITGIPFE